MNLLFAFTFFLIFNIKILIDLMGIHYKNILVSNIISDYSNFQNLTKISLVNSIRMIYFMKKFCNNGHFCLSTTTTKTTKTLVKAKRKRLVAVNLVGYPNKPLAVDPLDINSSTIHIYKEKYKIKTINI